MDNLTISRQLDSLDADWRRLSAASLEAQRARDYDAAAAYDRRRWAVLDRERAILESRHASI